MDVYAASVWDYSYFCLWIIKQCAIDAVYFLSFVDNYKMEEYTLYLADVYHWLVSVFSQHFLSLHFKHKIALCSISLHLTSHFKVRNPSETITLGVKIQLGKTACNMAAWY